MMKFVFFLFLAVQVAMTVGFAPLVGTTMQRFRSLLNINMQVDVSMPALSSTMKEGKIVAWAKKVGDKVSSGDTLLVVESDKADMDVESYEDGYLAAIYTKEGETAEVGAVVCTIVENKDDIAKITSPSGSAPPVSVAVAAAAPAAPAAAPAASAAAVAPSGPKPAFESIMMPALSSTMKEGKIVSWGKKVGDKVSSGDCVLVVESDKADMDVESYDDGFLAVIVVKEGEVATVGEPVAYIAATAAEIPAVQAYVAGGGGGGAVAAAPVAAAPAAVVHAPAAAATVASAAVVNSGRVEASPFAKVQAKEQGIDLKTVTPSRADGLITARDLAGTAATLAPQSTWVPSAGTINATPKAKKLAEDNGVDIASIKGTGNFNRVTPDDVLKAVGKWVDPNPPKVVVVPAAALAASVAAPAKENNALDGVVAMDGMQKAVAKNMMATLSVPIFRVSRDIFTDDFDALYAKLKPMGITVSAMLAKACAIVLKKHPVVNAAYVEGGIKYNKDVNVAMAVAIDGGLITPTIIRTNEMDLFAVGRKWKELVGKAKDKKLTPAEYNSGTFTISNLGMFGVGQFDAILPPGTGAILAIAASTPKVVQKADGSFGVRKSMTVTITCDHRHIYGADAAEFLKDLAALLENDVETLPWAEQ